MDSNYIDMCTNVMCNISVTICI